MCSAKAVIGNTNEPDSRIKPNLKIYKENVVAIQTDISVTPEYKILRGKHVEVTNKNADEIVLFLKAQPFLV